MATTRTAHRSTAMSRARSCDGRRSPELAAGIGPRCHWRGRWRAQRALQESEKQLLRERKKPRFPAERGAEGYLRHSAEGFPSFRTKAIRIAANSFRLPEKKTPHRGRMRGLFGYPSSLLDGERRPQGVAKRPPLPAEMSDT